MAKKLTPITPGDVLLEEFLKPMEIAQNQLAKDINVPANRVSQIIHGKREILIQRYVLASISELNLNSGLIYRCGTI